jgi:hypothetical protein
MKKNKLLSWLGHFGLILLATAAISQVPIQEVVMIANAADTSVATKTLPNAQLDLPPMYPANLAGLEDWFRATGRPWSKQELVLAKRKLLCIDLEPYSGQPGHHAFLYQLLGNRPALLFAAVVWNPPRQGVALSFRYKEDGDSLEVLAGDGNCFSVKLSTLWCD